MELVDTSDLESVEHSLVGVRVSLSSSFIVKVAERSKAADCKSVTY